MELLEYYIDKFLDITVTLPYWDYTVSGASVVGRTDLQLRLIEQMPKTVTVGIAAIKIMNERRVAE